MVCKLSVSLLAVVILFSVIGCEDQEFAKLIRACKQIELGMSEDKVLLKMGAPAFIESSERNQRRMKRLAYAAPAIAAAQPYVVIDPESKLVEEVMCDDQFHLVAPRRQT